MVLSSWYFSCEGKQLLFHHHKVIAVLYGGGPIVIFLVGFYLFMKGLYRTPPKPPEIK